MRVRGNANQVMDKYLALARDASSQGDRVLAENFLQHADHYFRILSAAGGAPRPQRSYDDDQPGEGNDESDDSDNQGDEQDSSQEPGDGEQPSMHAGEGRPRRGRGRGRGRERSADQANGHEDSAEGGQREKLTNGHDAEASTADESPAGEPAEATAR